MLRVKRNFVPALPRLSPRFARFSSAKTVHWTVFFRRFAPPSLFSSLLTNENKKRKAPTKSKLFFGAPRGTRTPDLLVRSQTLYPAELLAHLFLPKYIITNDTYCQAFFKNFANFRTCFAAEKNVKKLFKKIPLFSWVFPFPCV